MESRLFETILREGATQTYKDVVESISEILQFAEQQKPLNSTPLFVFSQSAKPSDVFYIINFSHLQQPMGYVAKSASVKTQKWFSTYVLSNHKPAIVQIQFAKDYGRSSADSSKPLYAKGSTESISNVLADVKGISTNVYATLDSSRNNQIMAELNNKTDFIPWDWRTDATKPFRGARASTGETQSTRKYGMDDVLTDVLLQASGN
jgi:hypothetical protein